MEHEQLQGYSSPVAWFVRLGSYCSAQFIRPALSVLHVITTSRLRRRWEDNIREWAGPQIAKSPRAVENKRKMEETDCEVICGAETTPEVKG